MEHTEGMEIYNNQGKFICKIEPPVTYKDIPLSASIDWQEPTSVVQWAWETAQKIAVWDAENHPPAIRNDTFLYESGALCQACLKNSILPEIAKDNGEVIGYSCRNDVCPMQKVHIPQVLVEKSNEKPLGLEFTPFLMALKEKFDKDSNILDNLVSASESWLLTGQMEQEKSQLVPNKEINLDKTTQFTDFGERLAHLIKAGLCTRCERPIIGTLKNQEDAMNVCFSDYVYLSIYAKTGLCINCIDEFLGGMSAILK